MFELHVWGPAFGLPSIDPHCLAAIAYLQQAVPAGKWVVTASSNPTISPTYELPALRDGDIWIGGFRNIFHYLAQHSSGKWILDVGLSEQEGADCIAYFGLVTLHMCTLTRLSNVAFHLFSILPLVCFWIYRFMFQSKITPR